MGCASKQTSHERQIYSLVMRLIGSALPRKFFQTRLRGQLSLKQKSLRMEMSKSIEKKTQDFGFLYTLP